MADPNLDNKSAPTPMRVPALLREYQRQQDTWREQTFELARLRSQLLAAGEQDAVRIVTSARVAIRRVLVDTRRELLGLAIQIDAIQGVNQVAAQPAAALSGQAGDELDSRNRVLAARHELRRTVAEARQELDTLQNDVLDLQVTSESRRRYDRKRGLATVERDRSIAIVATVPLPSRWGPRTMAMAGIVTVVSGALALGAVNWYRRATIGARQVMTAPPNSTRLRPSNAAMSDKPSASPVVLPKAREAAWALAVQARRPAWIQATIDGHVETGRLFRAGELQRMTGAREVSLRVGDAGAVFVSVAGREPAAMGRDGEVVTRRFTADGPGRAPDARSAPSISPPAVAQPPSKDRSLPRPDSSDIGDRSPASVVGRAAAARGALTAIPVAPQRETATRSETGLSEISRELTDSAQQWLDAYYRHDVVAMRISAAPDITISDARHSNQRPAAGLTQRRLALEQVTSQIVGDTAVLTGRMIEQVTGGNDVVPYVSWFSQTWLRATGQWHLVDVRIVSDSQLQKK